MFVFFFKGRQIEICRTVSIIFVLTVAKIKRKIPNNGVTAPEGHKVIPSEDPFGITRCPEFTRRTFT